ncbi:MAG: helix-turn-helix domain-containing protein [Microcoleus sp.]
MMALKPDAFLGVTDNPTIEVSQENFRSVIGQIENELLCSDTYSHALAILQTMLGEAASAAEILIRAVSREAVKLAFQRFPKQNKTQLQTAPDIAGDRNAASAVTELKPPLAEPVFYQRQAVLEAPRINPETENSDRDIDTSPESQAAPEEERQEAIEPDRIESQSPTIVKEKPFSGFGFLKPKRRLTKEEKAALAVEHRAECLRQLGGELRRGRQTRSLSLQQLHCQTFVPLHHLEALENGDIETLPQDIYVRGFIRRIGDALGLDGTAMANSLPEPEPSQVVIPSFLTQDSESESDLQLRPAHLYLGYTALMAGAVGGLAWLSQQPAVPGTQAVPAKQVTPPPSVTPVQQREAPTPQPGVKKSNSHGGTIVGADMAPPEVIFG